MRNKQSKFSKKAKSLTVNAEVAHLPKEPHSALALVVALAVPPRKTVQIRVVATVNITSLATRAVRRVAVPIRIRLQSTGSKST